MIGPAAAVISVLALPLILCLTVKSFDCAMVTFNVSFDVHRGAPDMHVD
jgi:hypothetical protein